MNKFCPITQKDCNPDCVFFDYAGANSAGLSKPCKISNAVEEFPQLIKTLEDINITLEEVN